MRRPPQRDTPRLSHAGLRRVRQRVEPGRRRRRRTLPGPAQGPPRDVPIRIPAATTNIGSGPGSFGFGTGSLESHFFAGAPGSFNGIDFAGDQIGSISMILGSDLVFTGSSLSGDVTFQFDGVDIPEPTTLLLLGSGLAGIAALKTRRNPV
jgi:hypothetical protein